MTTKRLADFVVETSYHQIPEEAIRVAKEGILDSLGTSLASTKQPVVEIIAEYVREMGGMNEAGVIANGFKTSAPLAALVNGTMAHALDYDDAGGFGHPSAVLMPAVLALGEKGKLSGEAILEAYILGFEVGAKISQGLGRNHEYEGGWHSTATIGTMAATAAAAKIIKADVQEVRMALGIAASLTCGVRQNFGTMTKPFHAGKAAWHGVIAASLARKGFTADESILEAPMGYGRVFSPEYDLDRIVQGLGSPFSIVSPGISFKPYPCCRATHRCLDAILFLIRQHNISAANVDEVECQTSSVLPQLTLIHHCPKTALEGKFSMEYCMARALLDREVHIEDFTDEKVSSDDAQDLISKVKFHHRKEQIVTKGGIAAIEARRVPEVVTIRIRDGTEYCHKVEYAKGDPRNPLTQEELTAKFRDCAHQVLSTQDIERCVELILRLESLKDVSLLMDVLTSAKGN